MTENKNEGVYLVPGKDTIYAIPVSICEKYKLEGQSLESAQIALSGDVVGQAYDPYAPPTIYDFMNGNSFTYVSRGMA